MSAPRRQARRPAQPFAAPTALRSALPAAGPAWIAAGALVALEGCALVTASVVYGLSVHDEGHGVSAWGAAAIGSACGAGLAGLLARAVLRASQSAIAPTVLVQLICLGEAFNMAQESLWPAAIGVAAVALAALACVGLGLRGLPSDPA